MAALRTSHQGGSLAEPGPARRYGEARKPARANSRANSGRGTGLPITPAMTVVFRVAAGPRIGFGHLVRCRSLARALGVEPRVSIRGTAATRRRAAQLGWCVLGSRRLDLGTWKASVLVVDDPSQGAASAWVATAHRLRVPVMSIHDVGVAPVPAQISIDGSVGRTADCGTMRALRGPRFAVLDPAVVRHRRAARHLTQRPRVLVALGGGFHALRAVVPLVATLVHAHPGVEVRVAAGFATTRRPLVTGCRVVSAPGGLAGELAQATVAVVAGGVTLYEACALGVPVVATAVAPSQRPTVAAMTRAGAAWSGGSLRNARDARRLARATAALLADATARRALGRRGRQLVDGRGVWRVAAAVRRLADAA